MKLCAYPACLHPHKASGHDQYSFSTSSVACRLLNLPAPAQSLIESIYSLSASSATRGFATNLGVYRHPIHKASEHILVWSLQVLLWLEAFPAGLQLHKACEHYSAGSEPVMWLKGLLLI